MKENIFGEKLTEEATLQISYVGPSFEDGEMEIRLLYKGLQSTEKVLRDAVDVLVKNGKLDPSFKDLEIYVKVEKGSVREVIKIVFSKSSSAQIAKEVIVGFVIATYTYYLTLDEQRLKIDPYSNEIGEISTNAVFKENLANIISALNHSDDIIIIADNERGINLEINKTDKNIISSNLYKEHVIEDPSEKNGTYTEHLRGVIRKIDLDASSANYFGFNVENGSSKVPTSIQGEIHLNQIRSIINIPLAVTAEVRYKDSEIKHIYILDYNVIDEPKTKEISFDG